MLICIVIFLLFMGLGVASLLLDASTYRSAARVRRQRSEAYSTSEESGRRPSTPTRSVQS
jgi:hypothetical protein